MAITFDDAMSHQPPAYGNYLSVPFTLVITQDDGRTGYASGSFGVDQTTRTLTAGINNADIEFDVYIVFSDRERFTGDADRMGVEIFQSPGVSGLTLRSTLKSWGDTEQTVQVELWQNYASDGKLYRGRGETIGHGRGKALHVLSLNDITEKFIVLY